MSFCIENFGTQHSMVDGDRLSNIKLIKMKLFIILAEQNFSEWGGYHTVPYYVNGVLVFCNKNRILNIVTMIDRRYSRMVYGWLG